MSPRCASAKFSGRPYDESALQITRLLSLGRARETLLPHFRGDASRVHGLKLRLCLFEADARPQAPEGNRPANPRIVKNRAVTDRTHGCELRNQADRYKDLAGDAEIGSVETLLPDANDRQRVSVRDDGFANDGRVASGAVSQ